MSSILGTWERQAYPEPHSPFRDNYNDQNGTDLSTAVTDDCDKGTYRELPKPGPTKRGAEAPLGRGGSGLIFFQEIDHAGLIGLLVGHAEADALQRLLQVSGSAGNLGSTVDEEGLDLRSLLVTAEAGSNEG